MVEVACYLLLFPKEENAGHSGSKRTNPKQENEKSHSLLHTSKTSPLLDLQGKELNSSAGSHSQK